MGTLEEIVYYVQYSTSVHCTVHVIWVPWRREIVYFASMIVIPSVCEEVRVRLWIVLIGRGVIDCVLCDEPHVLC